MTDLKLSIIIKHHWVQYAFLNFVRFKTGLSYTAILSALIMSGCTLTGQQEQPLTPAAKAEMEMKQYQKVIDDAQGLASLDVIRAYIGLETLITDPQLRQKKY
ncbi:hypothetical protein PROPEN_03184 [Proteus penneri ATCC 35198]|nr:hypothetical protein PROPEN_03184 [Proteus penneri ATCC 35198]